MSHPELEPGVVEVPDLEWFTTERIVAFNDLMQQLRGDSTFVVEEDQLRRTIRHGHLLCAMREDLPAGTLTLITHHTPEGTWGYIESAVTDARRRGQGIMRALERGAVVLTQAAGGTQIDLTSSQADGMWARLGYERRPTNTMRKKL